MTKSLNPVVPDAWREPLRQFIRDQFQEDRGQLLATVFKHDVWLRFPDGSSAIFKYALYLIARGRNEVAVFTEHCGYHAFPLHGTTN